VTLLVFIVSNKVKAHIAAVIANAGHFLCEGGASSHAQAGIALRRIGRGADNGRIMLKYAWASGKMQKIRF
jgi:hypothetical protein